MCEEDNVNIDQIPGRTTCALHGGSTSDISLDVYFAQYANTRNDDISVKCDPKGVKSFLEGPFGNCFDIADGVYFPIFTRKKKEFINDLYFPGRWETKYEKIKIENPEEAKKKVKEISDDFEFSGFVPNPDSSKEERQEVYSKLVSSFIDASKEFPVSHNYVIFNDARRVVYTYAPKAKLNEINEEYILKKLGLPLPVKSNSEPTLKSTLSRGSVALQIKKGNEKG